VNLLEFIRTIFRNWKLLVFFPLVTACVVFFLTRNTKKEYVSNTQVYTGIASGYGITSGENDRVDYFAVNNAFDNLMATIKSRESIEEVGMRLLAKHLLIKEPSYKELSEENFNKIRESIPEKLRQELIVKGSVDLTFFKIESFKKAKENNEVVQLLSAPGSIYSLDVISSNMSALRKQSSDMIEISYKSNDPAVCQQTLQFIVDVVISRYKGIKGQETNNVVNYFEEQLRQAALRLRQSEDRLRDYSSQNKIINYYEQAKFVAEAKENVTADRQKQEEALDASKAALKRVEQKIEMKKNILEVNAKLSKLREQLSEVTYKIANAELYK
jgi:polysaccharide biosynthesis transport protein